MVPHADAFYHPPSPEAPLHRKEKAAPAHKNDNSGWCLPEKKGQPQKQRRAEDYTQALRLLNYYPKPISEGIIRFSLHRRNHSRPPQAPLVTGEQPRHKAHMKM